jgi:hypothetical protein
MPYSKPELNVVGAAESLVLGPAPGSNDFGSTTASSAFEFEE